MAGDEQSLAARRQDGRVAAITGVRTFLGAELALRLADDDRYREVIGFDIQAPEDLGDEVTYRAVDLTSPTVSAELAALLLSEDVDTLVHGAFLTYPTHASSWAHELEDVGTMHVLDACARAGVRRLVLLSTTLVYGPSRDNPNYLVETDELRGQPGSRYFMDKVRAERQVARFAEEHPGVSVAVLRFAPILGPTVQNFWTRFLSRPVAPSLMGHDPLVQVVHEADAARAAVLATSSDATGAFNIVGDGVLPYSTVLALLGRVPMPLPTLLARTVSRALWRAQLSSSPPSFLDFLRYLCVADGTRAREVLGFRPRRDIRRTLADFLGDAGELDPVLSAHG